MDRAKVHAVTTPTKRYFRRGPFLAEVTIEGNTYRFAIRDESHVKPTIHGAKSSLRETETEIATVLDCLFCAKGLST